MNINKLEQTGEPNLNSNLIPRTENDHLTPCKSGRFKFMKNYGGQNGAQKFNYKRPQIQKGRKWYVYYRYRIPADLADQYPGERFHKFKVYEDINVYKSREYAEALRDAVEAALKDGYNPFKLEKKTLKEVLTPVPKPWTIIQAMNYFMTKWADRGIAGRSLQRYKSVVTLFANWLTKKNLHLLKATEITDMHIEACLQESAKKSEWSNRYYNNQILFLRTVFNFLQRKKIITDNPTVSIDRKKSKSKKHRFYDQAKLDLVKQAMKEHDPLLFFASRLIYYLCIRSEKELQHFHTDNIFIDTKQALIKGDEAKGDDRLIPIPDELIGELKTLKKKYPGCYVIGVGHKNKYLPENHPSKKTFARNFLSNRFSKIRKKIGLSSDYTLYGFKHTRIIHLKQDGGRDADIMGLTGHHSFEAYSKYLRDLGLDANPEALNKISRKF